MFCTKPVGFPTYLSRLLLVALIGLGSTHVHAESTECQHVAARLETFTTASADLRGVALVAHGFNLKPSRLDAVINLLKSLRFSVVRLTLTGHDGDMEQLRAVNRAVWLNDMRCATLAALAQSQQHDVPLYFVGVSLGGLLNVDFINESSTRYFSKRVLLAPALRLHWYTHLLRGLNGLPFDIDVPSRSPQSYRVHDKLPMTAYNALFASVASVRELNATNLSIPTLIFISPDDELVSYQGLAQILEQHPQAPWTLRPLDNQTSTVSPHYSHNIVDPDAMGAAQWEDFVRETSQFLGG